MNGEILEEIASAASHDLSDPLREALEQVQRARAGEPLALDAVESRIRETLERLAALRQFAYIAQNTERAQETRIEQVLETVRAKFPNHTARIRWNTLPQATIMARPRQLDMLFTQLFDNALKHNISIEKQVNISVTHQDSQWECRVEDNGIGMEPEFRYFVQGLFKRITCEKGTGQGVGLAYCRRIAENHGGTLRIESSPSQGCRVIVTLKEC